MLPWWITIVCNIYLCIVAISSELKNKESNQIRTTCDTSKSNFFFIGTEKETIGNYLIHCWRLPFYQLSLGVLNKSCTLLITKQLDLMWIKVSIKLIICMWSTNIQCIYNFLVFKAYFFELW